MAHETQYIIFTYSLGRVYPISNKKDTLEHPILIIMISNKNFQGHRKAYHQKHKPPGHPLQLLVQQYFVPETS